MISLPWFRRKKEDDAPTLFARVFRGDDGEKALEALWAMTLDQACGPEVSADRLMHLEGQRFIVRWITGQVERGRKGK